MLADKSDGHDHDAFAFAPGAADFAMYLLSPQGHSSLKAFGFIPVALPVAK